MRVARCIAGAQDGPQYITGDASRGRGHGRRPSVLTQALLLCVSHGHVEERVSLNHNCMAVRPLGRRMVAPRAPPGPWVLWGRVRAVGCVWMRVHAAPSGRVWAVPTPSRSRDGLRPSPREQLYCAFNRQTIGHKVSDFIKLSYMNMWCYWGRAGGVLTVRLISPYIESSDVSSLVEGLVHLES